MDLWLCAKKLFCIVFVYFRFLLGLVKKFMLSVDAAWNIFENSRFKCCACVSNANQFRWGQRQLRFTFFLLPL